MNSIYWAGILFTTCSKAKANEYLSLLQKGAPLRTECRNLLFLNFSATTDRSGWLKSKDTNQLATSLKKGNRFICEKPPK